MRTRCITLAAVVALGAGCTTSVRGPARLVTAGAADGFAQYDTTGTVVCGGRPVSFDGSRTRIEAASGCRSVRVTGAHNDIIVQMAPAGVIEVTGAHNDVWWRPVRPGPATPPVYRDLGASNTLHRDED